MAGGVTSAMAGDRGGKARKVPSGTLLVKVWHVLCEHKGYLLFQCRSGILPKHGSRRMLMRGQLGLFCTP